jgi:phosphatidylglycerol lysyltransferase
MKKTARTLIVPSETQYFFDHSEMPEALAARLEELAFKHGRYFDSYIITEPNRHYFWSSSQRAVVGCCLVGKCLNIAGGLICDPEFSAEFAGELVAFAELNSFTVSIYCLNRNDADLLEPLGFETTKYGEEASILLSNLSWSGKKMEWVRRQVNYVKRHEVVFEEVTTPDTYAEDCAINLDKIEEVSGEHLSGKVQKGVIPFFEGCLLPGYIHRRRIFVARSTETGSRIEGFVVCNPFENGRQWAIEMYRQRSDAVRGTIPFLFHQTINHFQQEGADLVSLSPVPALRCETPLPDDSPLVRRILGFWYNHWNYVFDVPGIFHFKSRFRPDFSDIFVCVYPKATVRSVWAYAICSKTLDIKYIALMRAIYNRAKRRGKLSKAKTSEN